MQDLKFVEITFNNILGTFVKVRAKSWEQCSNHQQMWSTYFTKFFTESHLVVADRRSNAVKLQTK